MNQLYRIMALSLGLLLGAGGEVHANGWLTSRPPGMSCDHLLNLNANLVEAPPESRIYFQSQFEIQPHSPSENTFDAVVDLIGTWLKTSRALSRESSAKLADALSEHKLRGIWESDFAESELHILTRGSEFPENQTRAWALLFQHPDSQYPMARLWRTQVSLVSTPEGTIRVSLQVSYFSNPSLLIAGEPAPPSFHAPPKLFSMLAESAEWSLKSGIMPISGTPTKVQPKDYDVLKRLVEDPNRELPVVLFVRPPEYENVSDYSDYLAKLLRGQAIVLYESAATIEYQNLSDVAAKFGAAEAALVPASGGLMIYMPRTKWHRSEISRGIFGIPFDAEQFQDPDFADRVRVYVNRISLARHLTNPRSRLSTIWDLDRANLSAHLDEMRKAIAQDRANPPQPQTGNKEEFYKDLIALYEAELREIQMKLSSEGQSHAETQAALRAAQAEIAELKKQVFVKGEPIYLNTKSFVLEVDEFDPNERYVEMVQSYFSRTIVFSPQALHMVKKLNFDKPEVLFHILLKMASDLNQLIFVEKSPQYLNEFKLRTKFEISNESSFTRANSSIERERTVQVDGKTYVGWLHVKYGVKEPNMVRVYFDFDHDKHRIVITHIATHLRVASSAKSGGAR